MSLFLLLWGEAANVRHLPEGMCYIFYCAASSLLVRDTTALNDATSEVPAPLYAWSRAKGEPVPAAELVAAAEGHYLQRVITPLFLATLNDAYAVRDEQMRQAEERRQAMRERKEEEARLRRKIKKGI